MAESETDARMSLVRAAKEDLVRASEKGLDDLTPLVEVVVSDHRRIAVWAPDVDRDQGLTAYVLLVSAFDPQEAWMAVDAHMSNQAINPLTGQPWEHGEMQAACDGAGACDLGLITDCMLLIGINHDGTEWSECLPYHVHTKERTVRWVPFETQVGAGMGQMDGLVIERMRTGWSGPSLLDMAADEPALADHQGRTTVQASALRMLADQGYVVMATPPPLDEALVWDRVLGDVMQIRTT